LFFKLLFNVKLIYSIQVQGPGFGAIGHYFSSVVGKGPSGANAPPVHGIKKCLAYRPDKNLFELELNYYIINQLCYRDEICLFKYVFIA
jgi:hypothetical protein